MTGTLAVAVTGVPQRQDQHAVIMARFSMECMAKVSQVTSDLTLTLGPDTAALKMRIGIHSGPGQSLKHPKVSAPSRPNVFVHTSSTIIFHHTSIVTAGVLRGDRARFQLFGDTVNTAAVRTTLTVTVLQSKASRHLRISSTFSFRLNFSGWRQQEFLARFKSASRQRKS